MQLLRGAQIQVCRFIPGLLAAVRQTKQTKQSWQQFPGRLAGRGSNKVTQVLVKDTTVVLISLVIQVNAAWPQHAGIVVKILRIEGVRVSLGLPI